MDGPWLVFLHGVNASRDDKWLKPLNAAMTWFGFEGFPAERVITPDYRLALRGGAAEPEPVRSTWKPPSKAVQAQAVSEYVARMSSLEAKLRPLSKAPSLPLAPPDVEKVPPIPFLVDDAKRYARDETVRNAVHETVLQSLQGLPRGSQVVFLAHSLGTVVAVDIIKRLPKGLRVAALVTLGSPLAAVGELRSAHDMSDFPYDRIGAWVNVYEPRDPVTGGKGVGKRYPEVCDVPVTLPDWVPNLVHQHHAHFYCAHPVVAGAIVGALYGTAMAVVSAGPEVDVSGLELLLLQSLYLRELAKRLPTDDRDRAPALERARTVTAASHASASVVVHNETPTTALLPPEVFLTRPDAHIRGAWDDVTLVAVAIVLASGPPAPPYRIEEKPDTEERRMALTATLNLVRRGHSEPTDVEMVEAIFAAREEVAGFLAPSRAWVPAALLGAGVLTLAATGVGIAVAVPAGLAGAALITSTLAAFGPGGMVGGMAALAALAGAGSAMAAAGAALGLAGGPQGTSDLMTTAIDEAIGSSDPESLRSLLISLLTLVAAQERLKYPTQRDQMLFACSSARARLSLRVAAHAQIDPRSPSAKDARRMLDLLDKALDWLRGEVDPSSHDARELAEFTNAYAQAIAGKPEALQHVLDRPTRRRHEPPEIEGPAH